MKKSSMLCRNWFRRTSVRDLVPDLKLLLAVITVGCESHCGVYLPAGLGEDSGLDPTPLAGALSDLQRRGEIAVDSRTGEIFVRSFFRDNTFKTPARRRQFTDDFMQIESLELRDLVFEAVGQNPGCGLTKDAFDKNQQLNNQGEGKGEGEGEGKQKKERVEKPAFSVEDSKKKEGRDEAIAFKIGKEGGLTDAEITNVIQSCHYLSKAPAAMEKAVLFKKKERAQEDYKKVRDRVPRGYDEWKNKTEE